MLVAEDVVRPEVTTLTMASPGSEHVRKREQSVRVESETTEREDRETKGGSDRERIRQ